MLFSSEFFLWTGGGGWIDISWKVMFEGTTNSLESLKEFRFEKSMFMFSKYLHKDDSSIYMKI